MAGTGRDQFEEIAESVPFDPDNCDIVTTDNVQEAIEEVCDAVKNKTIGTMFQAEFTLNGSAKNKWLSYSTTHNVTDKTPFLVPFDSRLIRITMSNSKPSADTDVEFHVSANGDGNLTSLAYTWPIRTKRVDCISPNTPNVDFDAGDKIGVYVKDQGVDLKDVIITAYFLVLTELPCSGENYSGYFGKNGAGTSGS